MCIYAETGLSVIGGSVILRDKELILPLSHDDAISCLMLVQKYRHAHFLPIYNPMWGILYFCLRTRSTRSLIYYFGPDFQAWKFQQGVKL